MAYLTLKEAGRKLGLSRQRIHQLFRKGRLKEARIRRGIILFTEEELDRFAQKRKEVTKDG